MKAIIVAAIALVAVIGLGAVLIAIANPASTAGDAAAAPVTPAAAVVREPVQTLCRSTAALMELCLSSDGRGLFSVFDGVETAHYVYVFYDAPGGCPQAMPGYQVRVTDWTLRDLQYVGFDVGDFAPLTVSEYYCSFAPLS